MSRKDKIWLETLITNTEVRFLNVSQQKSEYPSGLHSSISYEEFEFQSPNSRMDQHWATHTSQTGHQIVPDEIIIRIIIQLLKQRSWKGYLLRSLTLKLSRN